MEIQEAREVGTKFFKQFTDVPSKPVAMEGAEDVTIREIFTERDGTPTFQLRIFDVAPGGHTPLHQHDYEHEIFVLAGSGEVTLGEQIRQLQPGSTALIMPNLIHQFRNPGELPLRFMCLIPNRTSRQ